MRLVFLLAAVLSCQAKLVDLTDDTFDDAVQEGLWLLDFYAVRRVYLSGRG